MNGLFQEWWRRLVMEPPRYERPWMMLVLGVGILLFGFGAYLTGGAWHIALVGGVGAILSGVAEYLPSRWRAGTIALRAAWFLSLVVLAVLLAARLLS